ncbi:MAG TPA: HAD-IA family hydrolase [Jatrophihabitans sp.]|jgi:putative hydrolase of the HAD superfamily|nr:HAD-IA family hydrolase [Jatrophihabitans sp.]
MQLTGRQTLIFDADDTLWENNVIFERVVDDFIAWVAHPTLEPEAIRGILREIEEANIVSHGYGSRVFLRSLRDCFTRLTQRPVGTEEQLRFDEFADAFSHNKVELIGDVADVLDELATRHDLFLLTKGKPDEQQRKIDASGLDHHFQGIDIVPVKEPATYRRIVAERRLDPGVTWMIGNSPKSDIIAARAAGLRAVFVPHPNTWTHEHADLDPGDDGILEVQKFGELTAHF